jgi:hypothetical protein
MTDRPILFTAQMVRALLNGRKQQTRRIIKHNGRLPSFFGPKGDTSDPSNWGWETDWPESILLAKERPTDHDIAYLDLATTYRSGDRLWVRETWRTDASMDALKPKKIEASCLDAGYRRPWAPIQYEADGERENFTEADQRPGKTRVAIHMPRWASRLTLIVEAVKVERLQSIIEADAIAEGVYRAPGGWWSAAEGQAGNTPEAAFAALWQSINGDGAWTANPWVAAVTFRTVHANIDDPDFAAHQPIPRARCPACSGLGNRYTINRTAELCAVCDPKWSEPISTATATP